MLKVSYIYLLAAKVVGCALVLSGCAFLGSEPTYTLSIENNSGTPITYCYWPESSGCKESISNGEFMVRYYSHGYGGERGALENFGGEALEICGKVVSIDELEAFSPIEHVKGLDYKIIIGEQIGSMYCYSEGDS